MTATQGLEYRGRQMSAEPSNVSMANLVALLASGRTVYVCLEPGDETRYDLLITPFASIRRDDFDGKGLPTWNPDEPHLVVTRLVDLRPAYGAVIWPGCWDGEHAALATYGKAINEWTHELLTWWFARLWEAMS